MASSAHDAFRTRFERVIHQDTAAGGLNASFDINDPNSFARTTAVFYLNAPDRSKTYPYIVYSFTLDEMDLATDPATAIADVRLTVQIVTGQEKLKNRRMGFFELTQGTFAKTLMNHFGFGETGEAQSIESLSARLRVLMSSSTAWLGDPDGDGWSLSPMVPQEDPFDATNTISLSVRTQTFTSSMAETTSGAPLTGAGLVISGDWPTGGGTPLEGTIPFQYQIDQQVQLVDRTRRYDDYQRMTTDLKSTTLLLRFVPGFGVPEPPIIPVGDDSNLNEAVITLELGDGREYVFKGFFRSMNFSQSKDSSRRASGGYVLQGTLFLADLGGTDASPIDPLQFGPDY